MSVASNTAYVKKIMGKITRAVDISVQEVVQETLTWMIAGTVQDSGNAAFFWNVGIDGSSLSADTLRGTGHAVVGSRGDARQPSDQVVPSKGLSGLSSEAEVSFTAALNRYTEGVKQQIVFKSGKYPKITINNQIGDLGEGFELYERNALFLVAVAEGVKFGADRGYEKAEVTSGAAGIVKKV